MNKGDRNKNVKKTKVKRKKTADVKSKEKSKSEINDEVSILECESFIPSDRENSGFKSAPKTPRKVLFKETSVKNESREHKDKRDKKSL